MKNNRLLQYSFLILVLLLMFSSMDAQNIAPFVDKYGYFKVFDNGKIQVLEKEEVSEVKVGGDYVIYTDIDEQIKKYTQHKTQNVNSTDNLWYRSSQYFLGIVEGLLGETLKVQYGESEELLSIDMDEGAFSVRDSVLTFRDNFGVVNVFYNGKTHELGKDVRCRVSSNSVVFMDSDTTMRVFHEGKIADVYNGIPKKYYEFAFAAKRKFGDEIDYKNSAASKNKEMFKKPVKTGQMLQGLFRASKAPLTDKGKRFRSKSVDYKHYFLADPKDFLRKTISCHAPYVTCWYSAPYNIGDNFVVFVDENERLMAYDEGILSEVVSYQPRKYRVGEKLIIFLDEYDGLMIYWNRKIQKLTDNFPVFQAMTKNTLTYVDDLGYFYVWDEGKKTRLEAYQPKYVALGNNIVVYTDSDGHLKAYYEGEKIQVSEVSVNDFQVIGRVILYTMNNNEVKIFHDGKHYSG